MDELTLLRDLRGEPPGLMPEARYAARMRLRREIGFAYPDPRRRNGRIAVCAALAAVVVAGAVAISASDGTPAGSSTLAGADRNGHGAALRSQAAAAAAIPRADQYLYSREVLVETPVAGGRPERLVDEMWRSVDGLRPSRESERGRSWTAAPLGDDAIWPPRSQANLERLPTDPVALRAALLERTGGPGGSPAVDDETVYMHLVMLLRGWRPMPPGLRAAAFDAVTRIPGVRTVDDVDARGRPGLRIERAGDRAEEIIVDPGSYEYLGFRDVFVTDEGVTVDRVSALVRGGVVDAIGQRP
jgi:hypothetical protein